MVTVDCGRKAGKGRCLHLNYSNDEEWFLLGWRQRGGARKWQREEKRREEKEIIKRQFRDFSTTSGAQHPQRNSRLNVGWGRKMRQQHYWHHSEGIRKVDESESIRESFILNLIFSGHLQIFSDAVRVRPDPSRNGRAFFDSPSQWEVCEFVNDELEAQMQNYITTFISRQML